MTTAPLVLAGNIYQLVEHNSWDFHKHLIDTYGPVAKIQSFLGVRTPLRMYRCNLPDMLETDEVAPRVRSKGTAQHLRKGPRQLLSRRASDQVCSIFMLRIQDFLIVYAIEALYASQLDRACLQHMVFNTKGNARCSILSSPEPTCAT